MLPRKVLPDSNSVSHGHYNGAKTPWTNETTTNRVCPLQYSRGNPEILISLGDFLLLLYFRSPALIKDKEKKSRSDGSIASGFVFMNTYVLINLRDFLVIAISRST